MFSFEGDNRVAHTTNSATLSVVKESPSKATEFALQVSSECLGLRARRLGRDIGRIYDTALAPLGLTGPQFTLLAALQILAPVSPVELSRQIGVEKSTLSRNLKLMENEAWVKTTTRGNARSVTLTAKGRGLLIRSQDAWKDAQAEASQLVDTTSLRLLQSLPPV